MNFVLRTAIAMGQIADYAKKTAYVNDLKDKDLAAILRGIAVELERG